MKNRIHDVRRERALSQAALATLTGVSRQAINAIENDRHDPSVSLAFAIAAALGVPVTELFITKGNS
jgi:putative transcriptional regulator